jgi:hypothetical protein
MRTISLRLTDGHLAALQLLAKLNGHKSAVEELKAESRDFLASCLQDLSTEDITEVLDS